MTEQEYRDCEGVRRSELWLLNPENGGSPEKYKWFKEHPEPETPALLFGRVVHKLLLEHQDFFSEFCITPRVDRRTREGREKYAEFEAAVDGRTQISGDMYRQALEMTMKAIEEPFVNTLIAGRHEVPITWTDEETGVKCKARLDCLTEIDGQLYVVDYKTTTSAHLGSFSNSAFKYGYHFQAAMYLDGVKAVTGRDAKFFFIAQEKDEPYAVCVYAADDEFIHSGEDKFRELIGIYRECEASGNWYGYMGAEPAVLTLQLPAWAVK